MYTLLCGLYILILDLDVLLGEPVRSAMRPVGVPIRPIYFGGIRPIEILLEFSVGCHCVHLLHVEFFRHT